MGGRSGKLRPGGNYWPKPFIAHGGVCVYVICLTLQKASLPAQSIKKRAGSGTAQAFI